MSEPDNKPIYPGVLDVVFLSRYVHTIYFGTDDAVHGIQDRNYRPKTDNWNRRPTQNRYPGSPSRCYDGTYAIPGIIARYYRRKIDTLCRSSTEIRDLAPDEIRRPDTTDGMPIAGVRARCYIDAKPTSGATERFPHPGVVMK